MSNVLDYKDPPRRSELHDGKIVMMAPPSTIHARISARITGIFTNYLKGKKCEYLPESHLRYDKLKRRYIPDGMVVCDPDIIKNNGVVGTPDLVIEIISPSSFKHDRGHKKDVYEEIGVKEYWIVHPNDKAIEVQVLKDGKFVLGGAHAVIEQWVIDEMTEDEIDDISTKFSPTIFDDLVVDLEDIFEDIQLN